jgi:CSLREA domain-containing protein
MKRLGLATGWIGGGLVAVALAMAPASKGAAAFGTVVDLGQNVIPSGAPAVVGAQVEVPVVNGIWVNGTVETPTAPASDPTATFLPQAISSTGVVVGFTLKAGGDIPAYWDSTHSESFVEVSMSGVTVNGSPVSSARFAAVDATGEAVGSMQNSAGAIAGFYVPGSGGLPAGTPQAVTSLGGAPVAGLAMISAGWEGGADSSGMLFAYNRQTGARISSNLTGLEGGPGGLADNGLLTGYVSNGVTSTPESLSPSGAYTTLQVPSGGGAGLYGINASGVVVGVIRSNTGNTGSTWSASSGVSTPLLSEVSANSPGFSSLVPTAIDDSGDIDGSGVLNGQTDGFLVRIKQIVPPVVTSTGDAGAADPSSGSCDTGQSVADATGAQVPECTLRAAIQAVNAIGTGAQQITFDIPPSALTPIGLNSPLPAITAPGTIVDGTTEGGGSVGLDGTKLGGTGSCLTAQAAGIVIRGFDLANCPTGVELAAPGQDKVQGDVIGLAADGATAAPGTTGVLADAGSTGNLIGGPSTTDRDVISAQSSGVTLNGSSNTVQGDLLGTDVTGHAFVPDQLGVTVSPGSSGDAVGGSTPTTGAPPGNVIVAGSPTSQFDYGVLAIGGSTTVAGNLIGTDITGTVAYAPKTGNPARVGVLVAGPASNDVIGGGSGSGNVIAGASLAQVELDGGGAVNPSVVGNRIGVGATGGLLASPAATGVLDAGAASAQIGDTGEANTITGQKDGVLISKDSQEIDFTVSSVVDGKTELEDYALPGTDSPAQTTGAVVKDNVIGPLPGGETVPDTPQQVGVLDIGGHNDEIGPGNVISFNGIGVDLAGTVGAGTEGNLIGSDAGGLDALPNGVGIKVEDGADKTPIGVTGTPDTISGNLLGVDLDAGVTLMHGELVGPTSRGDALLKAFHGTLPATIRDATRYLSHGGILVDTHAVATVIGGVDRGEGVTVGGTDGTGIVVRSPAIMIHDRVGVAVRSRTALPNHGDGLQIHTAGNEPALFGDGIVAHSGGVGVLVDGRRDAMIVGTPIYDNAKGGLEIHARDVPHEPKVLRAVNKRVGGEPRTVITTELALPRGDFGRLEVYATPSCERQGGGQEQVALATRIRGGTHKEIKVDVPTEPVGTAITALLTVTPGNDLAAQLDQRDKPDGRTSTFSQCTEVKAGK